jgi:hypothetical protein
MATAYRFGLMTMSSRQVISVPGMGRFGPQAIRCPSWVTPMKSSSTCRNTGFMLGGSIVESVNSVIGPHTSTERFVRGNPRHQPVRLLDGFNRDK